MRNKTKKLNAAVFFTTLTKKLTQSMFHDISFNGCQVKSAYFISFMNIIRRMN